MYIFDSCPPGNKLPSNGIKLVKFYVQSSMLHKIILYKLLLFCSINLACAKVNLVNLAGPLGSLDIEFPIAVKDLHHSVETLLELEDHELRLVIGSEVFNCETDVLEEIQKNVTVIKETGPFFEIDISPEIYSYDSKISFIFSNGVIVEGDTPNFNSVHSVEQRYQLEK